MENIAPSQKRFVPVAEYQRISGLSYATVMHMIKTKQINAIQTEGGHYKIDTLNSGNMDTGVIIKRLDEYEKMLKALCGHLGVR